MNKRDTRWLILIWVVTLSLLSLIILFVSKAPAQQCCPPGQSCPTPGYGGWGGVGIPGPYGGGVGVRAAPGRGVQVGVGGPYGGVVGAQVGGGRGVAVGVLPGQRSPTHNGWRGAGVDVQASAQVVPPGRWVTENVDPSAGIINSNRSRPYVAWIECARLTPNAPKVPVPGGYKQATSENDCGSAVVLKSDIPGTAILLTAAHVHRGPHDYYQVRAPGAAAKRARLFKSDQDQDIAAFSVPSAGLQFARIGDDPAIGDTVTLCGYGGNRYHESTGRVTGVVGGARWLTANWPDHYDGDSGAPVFDASNRLCGIAWGGSAGNGHFTPISIIKSFLNYIPSPGDVTLRPDVRNRNPPIFPDGPSPPPGNTVCRDQFDTAIEALKARDEQLVDRLMVHSKAIEAIKVQIDAASPGPPGPPGSPGQDGANADPAVLGDLEARLAALEALEFEVDENGEFAVDENGERKARSLFVHETYINGKFVDSGKVWRGDTLKYTSDLIDGAPTDSFRVEVESTGGTQ